jgi:hypothetical protein
LKAGQLPTPTNNGALSLLLLRVVGTILLVIGQRDSERVEHYRKANRHIIIMIIVRRILLVTCVSSVVIGTTISLLAYIGKQSDPSLRLYLGRRSLRNGENEVNVVVSASRRGRKFYDLSRFTEDDVSGENNQFYDNGMHDFQFDSIHSSMYLNFI